MDIFELLDSLPLFKDEEILKSFVKGYAIINNYGYKNILCSISGGSDSDVMLDIIYRIDKDKKVK
jgi:predicted phosphoadenosine phosphosulfate sulfurtransferase